ncbi:MAG: Crp/Fnr family transcriptional regulator [Chloroflexi bacterium]|nr:Crp/Fnr family transcriptional regulator [Chloroflexota bacterium]
MLGERAMIPLFDGLPQGDMDELRTRLRRRQLRAGQFAFAQGDPGGTLYIVETGGLKVALTTIDGREQVLGLLGPGDFCGELSLLDGEPHASDAIAREPTQLLTLLREDFLAVLNQRPSLAAHLLQNIVQRLRRNTQLAYDVAFLDVAGRLARVLLELARPAQAGESRLELPSKVTQTELAAMVGSTRESVNKWMGLFERSGIVRSEHGIIRILRPDRLRDRIV